MATDDLAPSLSLSFYLSLRLSRSLSLSLALSPSLSDAPGVDKFQEMQPGKTQPDLLSAVYCNNHMCKEMCI